MGSLIHQQKQSFIHNTTVLCGIWVHKAPHTHFLSLAGGGAYIFDALRPGLVAGWSQRGTDNYEHASSLIANGPNVIFFRLWLESKTCKVIIIINNKNKQTRIYGDLRRSSWGDGGKGQEKEKSPSNQRRRLSVKRTNCLSKRGGA